MSTSKTDPMAAMLGPSTEAFRFWISFWPVAPFFGVEWRFASAFPAMQAGMAGMPGMPGAGQGGAAASASDGMAAASAGMEAMNEAMTGMVEASTEAALDTAARMVGATGDAMEAAASSVVVAFEAPAAAARAAEPELDLETPEEDAAEEPEAAAPAPAAPATGTNGEAEAPAGLRPANLCESAPEDRDDLQMIKGIGPSLETQLNGLGIYRFEQIASFSDENLTWVNENLSSFKGRCFRDDWVGQARSLIS